MESTDCLMLAIEYVCCVVLSVYGYPASTMLSIDSAVCLIFECAPESDRFQQVPS